MRVFLFSLADNPVVDVPVQVVRYKGFVVRAVTVHLLRLFPCGIEFIGDIFHIFKESDCKTLYRKFFRAIHRPVSIFQVVMFDAAELLDARIAAMVVGHEQPLIGDDLSRAPSAELHDGIFQG